MNHCASIWCASFVVLLLRTLGLSIGFVCCGLCFELVGFAAGAPPFSARCTQNCSEDPANKRCDAGRWKKGCLKRQDSSIGVAHLSSVNVAVDDRFSGKSKKKVKLKLKVITNMLGWAALACIVGLQK